MEEDCKVVAPGVVKLFGEHVVMHGKPSVAAAISVFSTSSVFMNNSDKLKIKLLDLGLSIELSRYELNGLYKAYKSSDGIGHFISSSWLEKGLLPYATIAARLYAEFGLNVLGKTVKVSSDIKMQRGLASSAACSVAFATSLVKSCGAKMSDSNIIDVARDGDRIVHMNKNAGKIDVNASFYGGVVVLDSSGLRSADLKFEPKLLLIDTGPKKSTADTVGVVTDFYNKNPEKANFLGDSIEKSTFDGLTALKTGDLNALGKAMYENQIFLKEFGVSSESLEKGVILSKKYGFLGAKLTGGGGGGILIAIPKENYDKKAFEAEAKALGFEIRQAEITAKGAKTCLIKEKNKVAL